jgi:HEAT repeat protein
MVAAVACFAAIAWSWRTLEDWRKPSLGWAAMIRSSDVLERRLASRSLGDSARDEAGIAVPALVEAVADPDEEVAAIAVASLGTYGELLMKSSQPPPEIKAIFDGLESALQDRRPSVRQVAANWLARLTQFVNGPRGFPSDAGRLVASLVTLALKDPHGSVQSSAGAALVQVAHRAEVAPPPALVTILMRDGSAETRATAAAILATFRSARETTVPLLAQALEDENPLVRTAAGAALEYCGPSARAALPALLALMSSPESDRVNFSPPPAKPGDSPTGPQLIRYGRVATSEWDPAVVAIEAVGAIGSGEPPSTVALEALRKALRTGPASRRQAAEYGLALMGPAGWPAVPELIANMKEVDGPSEFPGYGRRAPYALGRVAPGSPNAGAALEALTAALGSRDIDTRRNAVTALAEFGAVAQAVLPRIKALEADPDRAVSSAARAANKRISAALEKK